MSLLEMIVVALALAMDAFAVSVAAGVKLRHVSGRQVFRLSWHFGLFQALMPVLGWTAGLTVQDSIASVDHWVAFVLLALIGGRMVIGALSGDEEKLDAVEPTKGWPLVMLSVATSIDALAVGLSMAMLGVSVWAPALVIGLVAGALTVVGLLLGGYAGRHLPVGRWANLVGGLVLLGIGIKILHDHGVF